MCNCKSGTEENHWFEVRDPACRQKEREDFGRAMQLGRELTKRLISRDTP